MIRAKELTIHCCEHGTVPICFHDEPGEIVAIASMPTDGADAVADDIKQTVADYNAGKSGTCGSVH
ncbi:MAG: hypothetical protein ACREUQ_10235 [Burkholderiales bacterium]